MGTRNLTMVIDPKGVTKVAQYGQWDGYPSGQGRTCLEFLKSVNLEEFIQKLESVQLDTNEQRNEFLKSIGVIDGKPANEAQTKLYYERYKLGSRNIGGGILESIMESEETPIVLLGDVEFAADSLFCEWAYVIDLQKKTLEVYEGFNHTLLVDTDRFFYLQEKSEMDNAKRKERGSDSSYYPVKCIKEYNLTELPEVEEFVNDCEPKDEEA
jgi:hypothetical protein